MQIFSFLFIYLFLHRFNYSLQYLFYELKTSDNKNNIESLLSFNTTYTNLKIGTPSQEVKFYFTLNNHQISFTNDQSCSPENSFFPKKSSTFKEAFEIEPRMNNDNNKYIYLDNLNTLNNLNNFPVSIEIEEFPFYSLDKMNISESTYLCGYIGIAIMQYEIYKPEEENVRKIYEKMEQYGIKKNEDFAFFNYKGKDYLIYGASLINQFPQFFQSVKGVEYVHPCTRKNSFDLFWEISMKEVYYNDAHTDSNKYITFEFNPLFEFIVGTNEFRGNIIKDYFQEYFNKGICTLDNYEKYNFKIISCQENKFDINDIKKFPNIYIPNLALHYTFELKGEDLFTKINNKWYFEIVFPIVDLDPIRWIVGRIFMRKYPVLFGTFSRLMGFYINKNIKTEKEKKEQKEEQKVIDKINSNNSSNKNYLVYILIIIVALVFTIVGLLIGKKIFFMRRKRANELTDDYYQYDTEKKDIKNINSINANIEMNSNLGIK